MALLHSPRCQHAAPRPVDNAGLELLVVETARLYLEQIDVLSCRIATLEKALRSEAKRLENPARLTSMPGMGPITAMAIEEFAPAMTTFQKGRDFAAWLGLVPQAAFEWRKAGSRPNVEDGPA
ncbi:transposase [Rhizobium sp. BK313]|nr:transposase [Rhizobium sp. BK313]MBB3452629.1 transposase [Rhizobium sp. BK313]